MVDAVDVSEMNTLEEQDESGEPKALPQLDINTLLKKKSPIVRSHRRVDRSRDGCTVGAGQWLIKDANHTNAEPRGSTLGRIRSGAPSTPRSLKPSVACARRAW